MNLWAFNDAGFVSQALSIKTKSGAQRQQSMRGTTGDGIERAWAGCRDVLLRDQIDVLHGQYYKENFDNAQGTTTLCFTLYQQYRGKGEVNRENADKMCAFLQEQAEKTFHPSIKIFVSREATTTSDYGTSAGGGKFFEVQMVLPPEMWANHIFLQMASLWIRSYLKTGTAAGNFFDGKGGWGDQPFSSMGDVNRLCYGELGATKAVFSKFVDQISPLFYNLFTDDEGSPIGMRSFVDSLFAPFKYQKEIRTLMQRTGDGERLELYCGKAMQTMNFLYAWQRLTKTSETSRAGLKTTVGFFNLCLMERAGIISDLDFEPIIDNNWSSVIVQPHYKLIEGKCPPREEKPAPAAVVKERTAQETISRSTMTGTGGATRAATTARRRSASAF